MSYLILGVLIWSLLHFVPAVPLGLRAKLIERTDEVVYKGLFAVVMVGSALLMILGWKSTTAEMAFTPPKWASTLNLFLMFVTSILFLAPYVRNNLRRIIRHPQLTGVLLWGVGHILATGQVRSLVFFGGMGVWAVIEMLLINRRDGAWTKPDSVPGMSDFRLLLAGLGFFAVFMFTHVKLFGVSPVPAW